ncbi:hypothetical protein H5410_056234 [Solanum commersonii]|uniref:Uncharacterized protein n=1 Tax=Solanum commersonii TaxID=4109 RepID=A0A9J5WLN2_SOLCO|nr:hypothetical protein H5410_056234 [Solanum commersonii]
MEPCQKLLHSPVLVIIVAAQIFQRLVGLDSIMCFGPLFLPFIEFRYHASFLASFLGGAIRAGVVGLAILRSDRGIIPRRSSRFRYMLRDNNIFLHDISHEFSCIASHLCLECVGIHFLCYCGYLCRIHNIKFPTRDRKEGRRAARSRDLEDALVLEERTFKRR